MQIQNWLDQLNSCDAHYMTAQSASKSILSSCHVHTAWKNHILVEPNSRIHIQMWIVRKWFKANCKQILVGTQTALNRFNSIWFAFQWQCENGTWFISSCIDCFKRSLKSCLFNPAFSLGTGVFLPLKN